MNFKKGKCFYCGKEFQKEVRRYNEAIKSGWHIYCSKNCHYKSATKLKKYYCANPKCNKVITKAPNEIPKSKKNFCSVSCSAIFHNRHKIKWKTCNKCGKKYYGTNEKFCSASCTTWIPPKPTIKITARQVIKELKDFYKAKGRIPYKKEYKHMVAARSRFGTWNKAIITAGLIPNPVKFANKHIANDGHKCDSLAEKIIDDWLFARKIIHKRKVPYNFRRMTADFKINNTYVEFLGLQGELKSYDELVKAKEAYWKEKKIRIIRIYPHDLFPKNRLGIIFKEI